ncbi:ubiquitin-conjugating enzyme E2 S [Fistulifera solaris]|uniref:E2 ubiquitin-conjugating enzyme n=1 Tax=Fistulifera solaris TaxID=1519565 RepID=A0A1Z5KAE3_FISSO|nr:ubiquitin-conjugating enzyme E2 S [Fistulifera solaris]|eukprot:GAX22908.1 ubiquitin-conjugating enzyme E2 S [Fistulifera solaris]
MSTNRISVYSQYTRSSSSSSTSENLPPRTLARLSREVRNLQKSPPEGVRLVVDEETGLPTNLGELMAEMQGPQGTPYEGKYFLLKLVFGSEFPAVPPRGFFLTKIFHPNVDLSTGAICVNTLKKDWTSETKLSHVLAVIRCLLIVPFPESSLNDEAGKLFMESYDEYAKRARLLADVHGRSSSVTKEGADPADDVTLSKSIADERGVLQSSSDSSRNNSQKLASSPVSPSKKLVAGAVGAKKVNKKKSLKRL